MVYSSGLAATFSVRDSLMVLVLSERVLTQSSVAGPRVIEP